MRAKDNSLDTLITGARLAIKAISLDFWNTLFTEAPGGFRRYQQTRLQLLLDSLSAEDNFTADNLEQAFMEEARSHNTIWRNEHRTLSTAERVSRVLKHLNINLSEDVTARLVTAYEEGILESPPVLIEGVREVVEHLAARYRIGLISDVGYSPGRVLRRVLDDAGILDLFDSLIFSDEAGCSKPHRKVFERTSQALGANPHEIVHIGDLEHTDIVGGRNAGYITIRFVGATPMLEGEVTVADLVTDDFREVPRLIEEIDQRLSTLKNKG